MAVTVLGLWGGRRRALPVEPAVTALRVPPTRYLALLSLPATASLIYLVAYGLELRWQVNWLLYLATTGAGFVLYAWAGLHIWGRPSRPSPETAPPVLKEDLP